MCIEQEITNVLPWAFASGPRSKELHRISIRLRPAAVDLQSFINPPSQVPAQFLFQYAALLFRVGGKSSAILCLIPTPFPNIDSNAIDGIDISSASNFVMAKDSLPKENSYLPASPA